MSVSVGGSVMRDYEKQPRAEIIAALRERDGDVCQYPGCEEVLDFTILSGPREVTIDHHIPQYFGKANGWTMGEIWALSNLRLMTKKCNARKGDRIPNEDGTLPAKPQSTFRFRRDKRANRPDGPCEVCDNGHNLGVNEVCAQCGMNAQRFPRWAKVKASECLHDGVFWCWACSIGVVEMRGATETMLLGGEGGDE